MYRDFGSKLVAHSSQLPHYKHRRHRSLSFFITWLDGLLSIDKETTTAAAIEVECFRAADVF